MTVEDALPGRLAQVDADVEAFHRGVAFLYLPLRLGEEPVAGVELRASELEVVRDVALREFTDLCGL